MAWPLIPDLIFTDSVTHLATTHGKDAAGGKTRTSATSGSSYRCAVMAASASDTAQHSQDGYLVSHVVTCETKIGRAQDILVWAETGSRLRVLAIEPAGDGNGRIWNHYCEEMVTS